MSRTPVSPLAVAWLFICLSGTEPANADTTKSEPAASLMRSDSSPEHAHSRQFFDRGVHLYRRGDVQGALAEFQAAYRVHPNYAALENVALCQKALFRYKESKATLESLLASHAHELTAADRATVDATIRDLATHIGSIKISVTPATAEISLDDSDLPNLELAGLIELDVGEHHLHVEAEGYEPANRLLSIADGANAPVGVALVPTHGFLTVLAPDEHSAIAVDGHAVAFESYRGVVLPGRHVIQVYRTGFEPYEAIVELEAGQSVTIRGKLGEPIEDDDAPIKEFQAGRPPRQLRGWYGLLDFSVLNWVGAPEFIDASGHGHLGYGYGLHAGYRLFTPIGIEAVISATHHDVIGTCEADAPLCDLQSATPTTNPNYQLDTRRAGGAMRLMSGGENIRFTSSIGIGAVLHDLHIFSKQPKGVDAYFALEAGAQVNLDHVLVELVGVGWFESASSITARDSAGQKYAPYLNGNGIQMFGLSLRVGWSEWTPRDARR
jgi:hypothetical protein